MSAIPKSVLLDWFPRAGFRWRRGQGSPRILRASARDGIVQRAISELCGGRATKVRKRDAQTLVVNALAITATTIKDAESGLRPGEGIIDFLERSAKFSDLPNAIPEDVWVELVYQIAHARNEYERYTPKAQKDGAADQLTALAFAIDDLVDAAGDAWDWMSLEFYAYPHLMGEAADYEIDSSGDEDDDSKAEKMDADEPEKELPQRMEKLTIKDADGDVEMAM
ncbi:hypothetical protein C8A00DRAFT_45677 [Chaetomidium leptoderma]|uniref:Uncharacterized protein n=1 Tax=Chaetomidium leptoderma TaxID=669021 RepID=A0AAN6VGF8_9PEZI|nr:hypothetical protein C8A00DRAFT_45677 [Chaetomidium leptoderma]